MAVQRLPSQAALELQRYLDSWRGFNWQSSNCAHFVAGWAGVDVSGLEMPHGILGMRHTFRALGVSSFKQAAFKYLGPFVSPSFAQIGDIVLSRAMLGICNGRLFAVPAADANGVVFLPMTQAEAAWHVDSNK